MHLSLSVRIAEGFLSKEVPILPLEQVAKIAHEAGYESICMRASQIGVHSSQAEVAAAKAVLDRYQLSVSMVTGDFDTVYNNDRGPNALRNIRPYVELAQQLGAKLIRVALKQDADIAAAQEAAEIADAAGIQLAHQCHVLSLFETVESIVSTLQQIDRPNFGLIYEPANLELCGQDYGQAVIANLAPWIFNVYLQNQAIGSDGAVTLETWCRGPVSFDIVPIHQYGGVQFEQVFKGLHAIGYRGTVTVHQSTPDGQTPLESAMETATLLRGLVAK